MTTNNCTYGTGDCGPTITTDPTATATSVAKDAGTGGSLPATGGDVVGALLIAAVALVSGVTMWRLKRDDAPRGNR